VNLPPPRMGGGVATGRDAAPWFMPDKSEEDRDVGLVLLIHKATDVPRMDVIGYSDTSATVWLERGGRRVGNAVRTPVCWRNANPVWKCYREFDFPVDSRDVVQVQLHDQDNVPVRQNLIGTGAIPVSSLTPGVPSAVYIDTQGRTDQRCLVLLERIPLAARPIKTVFLIRHAQSQWNAAQEAGALHRMMRYDHPLDDVGRQQSQGFRQRWRECIACGPLNAYYEAFLAAGAVYCSPFTRAIQTCVLALEGHQALQNKGIVLLGSAREIKKLGGLDTVGKVFGEKIVQRVKEQMALLMNDAEGKLELPCIDVNNAVAEWWTLHSTESQAEIAERFDDFMCTLKYVDAESIIVVGHSLFFLEFLGRYLGPEFRTAKPELSVELRTRKLQNCGCLGLTVDFTQRWPRVVDATLMFGSRLQEERGNVFGRASPTLKVRPGDRGPDGRLPSPTSASFPGSDTASVEPQSPKPPSSCASSPKTVPLGVASSTLTTDPPLLQSDPL